MDRSWMHSNRMSDEYAKGVEEFLTFAQAVRSETDVPETDVSETDVPETDVPETDVPETDVPETDVPETYSCPCCHCVNRTPQPPNIIRDHLFVYGILPNYTTWIWHGESTDNPSVPKSEKVDEDMDDRMEDMIRDVGPDAFKRAHEYDSLCNDKDEPLYLGCDKKYTRLTTSLKLINLKAIHGWTDKGFTELLELLADMLPIGNTLPKRTYDAKKILCPTSLEKFTNRLPPGQKYRLTVDRKGKIIGPYKTVFKNYLGVVARTKVSILPFSWDDVDAGTKRIAWDDVKQTFEVPENEEFKKKWMSHMGGCWKQFKTKLNNEYVFGNGDGDSQTTPCHKYSAISTDTWAAYVKSRTTPDFLAKREAAKNKQKKNIYKHTMGPGGYEKLKDNLKEEQIKKRKEESGDPNLEIEPTSPERHELWKAGRKTKSGSFVSEETTSVASKIDELTVMSSQGSFVSQGKNDILTAAIGTPEHPGRTRGAEKGVGLKKYFRSVHRSSKFSQEEFMNQMRGQVDSMVSEKLQQLLAERSVSVSCGGLCHNVAVQVSTPMTTVGSKGSCSPSNVKEEDEEEPEEKIDWLRKIHLIAYDDKDKHAKIELEHEKHICFIGSKGINDMVSGKGWLEMAHLSLWCTYLYRQVVEKGDDRYGFLCPHKMNLKAGNITKQGVSEYIQRKLATTNKEIYLAPFCNSNHWQLVVLLPKQNTVVWMCSLCRQPVKSIKDMFSNGLKGDSTSAATWLYPIMPIQMNGYHCGYYVMKFMLIILAAGIVDNWEKVFDNPRAYTEEELEEVRQLWAEFYVKIRTEQKDTIF